MGRFAEHELDGCERVAGLAAGALDQPGGHAFGVVEQHFQEMVGAELLVALAQRQALRRLHETLGAVGIFLEVHIIPPRHGTPPQLGARAAVF